MSKKKVMTKYKPLTDVTLVSKFEVEQNEEFFRVCHYWRVPNKKDEELKWNYWKGCVKQTWEEVNEWIQKESDDENQRQIIIRDELAQAAMKEFYKIENRNKYLYNE